MSRLGEGASVMGDDWPNNRVVVGICAMEKKSLSKPMREILTRLEEFEYITTLIFPEKVIIEESVEKWPLCDCLIAFHSKGFPLDKALDYAKLRQPFIINNLEMQYLIQDRRQVYATLEKEGIEIPRYAILDRSLPNQQLVEYDDHVEVNGTVFHKPFVEKPLSAEDHNIYMYYPSSAGGGSQRLFRKIGSRSSVYSSQSGLRDRGSYIYENFMPTDGTDVKVYTVGPDYAHAEARKSPALDGKVERDEDGKEVRYPVILSSKEKLIARKVCQAFKQMVCGFDLLRANGKSIVCDVNGFSFVKNSCKYYDDCAKILGNMILRELAPTLHIPWAMPFQLDDPPIVPTTVGKMMELRCVVAVIRHGDRTPKQKLKVEVRHPMFFDIFGKYDGFKNKHIKLKKPQQLQEILDVVRRLLAQQGGESSVQEEKTGKLEQIKNVLEMYGHFSGINRKVQLKYQPKGRPINTSSEDDTPREASLLLILKWGGELTPSGRYQAEQLGKIFRCMYPGGQDLLIGGLPPRQEPCPTKHLCGEYSGTQGLGLLRLHSTYRHDLKIYASDEGRVQMTAAAFAKGLLALEGELTPILVQMVKSANTNGLLDNDSECSSKYQNMKDKVPREQLHTCHVRQQERPYFPKHPSLVNYFNNWEETNRLVCAKERVKSKLHALLQKDALFSAEDTQQLNPLSQQSISNALERIVNPVACCRSIHEHIKQLLSVIETKRVEQPCDSVLYHGETWELMYRRWAKLEKDFKTKNGNFDISKVPDIYDCIKYDLQHNRKLLFSEATEQLYREAKDMADVVIPQEYGMTREEKLTIAQGICAPLLRKIRADLQRNIESDEVQPDLLDEDDNTAYRLNPKYSKGVSSPSRHVRTRLYFTSESHIHSLLTVLSKGGLVQGKDEQWKRAMDYVSLVSELNYMTQVVIMLYEDPTKEPCSEERFHVELHFSPGVNCCVHKDLPPGPGFRPHSRNRENDGCTLHNQMKREPAAENDNNNSISDNKSNEEISKTESNEEHKIIAENVPKEEKNTAMTTSDNPAPIADRSSTSISTPNLADLSTLPSKSANYERNSTVSANTSTFASSSSLGMRTSLELSEALIPLKCTRIDEEGDDCNESSNDNLKQDTLNLPKDDMDDCVHTCSRRRFSFSSPTSRRRRGDRRARGLTARDEDADDDHTDHDDEERTNRRMEKRKYELIGQTGPKSRSTDDSKSDDELLEILVPPRRHIAVALDSDSLPTEPVLRLLPQVWPRSHSLPPISSQLFSSLTEMASLVKAKKNEERELDHPKENCMGCQRHSLATLRMNSYLKFLAELAAKRTEASGAHLFSTAVISGSSSAPNLQDASKGEDCFNPEIRPLETLHNALSLRQMDGFLGYVTSATFRAVSSDSNVAESRQRQMQSERDSSSSLLGLGSGNAFFVSSAESSPTRIQQMQQHQLDHS